MPVTSRNLRHRARRVKLLLLDVDGVLTDGRIYYLPRSGGGYFETKTFHARDGFGLRLAHEAGLKTGIISGRSSPVVEHRASELGIHYLAQGAVEKVEAYRRILRQAGLGDEEVGYVADDIVDLPLLTRVGLAVGVSTGHPALRRHVHYWTRQPGGYGAVEETIEMILSAQGKWDAILKRYLR